MTFRVAGIAQISSTNKSRGRRSCALTLLALWLSLPAAAQSASQPRADELQTLITAASTARDTKDPSKVAIANARVLALALRRLANIRVAASAFPQAAELYRSSLAWEDNAETHVGLAICDLYQNRLDDSLTEADKALKLDPNSARAFNIQGKPG